MPNRLNPTVHKVTERIRERSEPRKFGQFSMKKVKILKGKLIFSSEYPKISSAHFAH